MRVTLRHLTRLEYDSDVVESVMDVRLGPRSDEDQRWGRFELRTSPVAAVRRYADAFGNIGHLITVAAPHGHLEITTVGEIETTLSDPFARPRTPPLPLDPGDLADYLQPSALIPRDDDLAALALPYRPASADGAFEAAASLMHLVHTEFRYRPDVTTVATTVPELLATRTGVCQDLAHVLVGLCRALRIPARYMSGYIVTGADGPKLGGGHSHAWAEAWSPTHGWRGFDPTNDLLASEHHVKMAVGRDYRDVPPTQGTFRGAADERLAVEVITRVA